jgi:hypothetical protein
MVLGHRQRPALTQLVMHQLDLGTAPALVLQHRPDVLPGTIGELIPRLTGDRRPPLAPQLVGLEETVRHAEPRRQGWLASIMAMRPGC